MVMLGCASLGSPVAVRSLEADVVQHQHDQEQPDHRRYGDPAGCQYLQVKDELGHDSEDRP